MADKHLQFPEKQTHDKRYEMAVLVFCAICIVFVLIAIAAVEGGTI